MSGEETPGSGSANLPVRSYEVGYGRPPAAHRFRKGQSGNPAGRPRKPKAKPIDTSFGMRAADEYLRMEAYRTVTVREGDRTIELPAIQAVFRAMGVAAMKGNRLSQRMMTELISGIEARDHASHIQMLENSFEYKIAWEREIERCRAAGLPEPTPVPHPDDMIIDPNSGKVRIEGPMTKEQKQSFDAVIARRTEAQEIVGEAAEAYRRSRSERTRRMWREEWHFEQRMFDIINEALPPRHRVKLENRSYAEGASREGKALEEIRRDKALRREYLG